MEIFQQLENQSPYLENQRKAQFSIQLGHASLGELLKLDQRKLEICPEGLKGHQAYNARISSDCQSQKFEPVNPD
jgi:hypothetical protein